MNKYPYWKVIIGFTLCPAVVGVLLGIAFFLEAVTSHKSTDPNPLLIGVATSAVMALVAVALGLVASLPLALLYATLKLRKGLMAYVLVAIAGGIGAFLVVRMIGLGEKEYIQAVADAWMTRHFWGAFLTGAVASLTMAVLVLPKRDP